MKYFIGIDIGTSHAKGIVLDAHGNLLFQNKTGYPTHRPKPGFEEQDPACVFEEVAGVLKESVRWARARGEIASIAFSAGMHSLMAVDEKGEALCNAMIWSDTRSTVEARQLRDHPRGGELYGRTGVPLHPMSPLCKIAWLKSHQPEIFGKAFKFISLKEFVFYKFFGKYLVDHSMASATGLFNIREKKWDTLALDMLGLSEERLSELYPVTHAESVVLHPYDSWLHSDSPSLFVLGGSDGGMANIGSGCICSGDATLTIGTSGAVRMTVVDPVPDKRQRLFQYALLDELYVIGGGNNNGGIVIKWLDGLFGSPSRSDDVALIRGAEQVAPGSDGLLFLPYLLGERAPVWDPMSKGILFGLQIRHGRNHIVRAALEGICFSLLEILDAIEETQGPAGRIHVSGGFTQSDFWLQLLADITGKELNVMDTGDASATGAAYCGMIAAGMVSDLLTLKNMAKPRRSVIPDLSLHAFYRERFRAYQSLYPGTKKLFDR